MIKASMIRDLLKVAVHSLRENRLRSFLTLLGLTIGVTSLITVMTVIEGANEYVADKIADLGSNVFQVTKLANISEGFDAFMKSFRRKDITYDNFEFIRDNSRQALRTGAQANASDTLRFGNQYLEGSSVIGTTANMVDIKSLEIADGRFFTGQEDQFSRWVGVIGWDVREKLYGGRDPLGQYIKIGGQPVRIVGVSKKIGSLLPQSADNFVYIPLNSFEKRYGSRRSLEIYVEARDQGSMQQCIDEVRLYLRSVRHRAYGDDDDFSIVTAATTIKLFQDITGSFFLVFVMLSAVAALVGGIVIMNIMLVSVTDRVMEIGVRRAVGGTRQSILIQFLLESFILCFAGGISGVGLGFLAALVFGAMAGVPAAMKTWVALFGVGLASVIGLFFGIYPAWKAARLDPVEALRSEK